MATRNWSGYSRAINDLNVPGTTTIVAAGSNVNGMIVCPCFITFEATLGAAFDLITTLFYGATISTNPPIWQKLMQGVAGTTFANLSCDIWDPIFIPAGNQLAMNFGSTVGGGRVRVLNGYKLL